MKKSPFLFKSIVAVAITLVFLSTGCRRPTPIIPSTPGIAEKPAVGPVAVEPMVTIRAEPISIERGGATTLTWEATNATDVTIDNGLGTVEASGSRTVRPLESTTYQIRAINNVAVVTAAVRITVTDTDAITPPLLSSISDVAWFDTSMQDVFFDLDEFTIRPDARLILQANARALVERPNIFITIEGHCDERGSSRHNLVLGDRRANSVRDYLVSLGIEGHRIETISYGSERPFCEQSTEECWQLNRRGRFVMR